MAVSNVAVTATSATVTVSSTDVTNVSVTQNTTDVTVGSAAIIANSDVRAAISLTTGSPSGNGSLTYTEATGVFAYAPADVPDTTDELTEGSTNLYYTSARAQGDVVSHIATVPLTVGGNLNVNGNIIAAGNIDYENVTDLYVTDQKITLNANAATNATVEIIANRPEDTDTLIRWNETDDVWQFSNDGTTFYNLPVTLDDVAQGTSNKYFKLSDKNSSLGAVTFTNQYYMDSPAILLEDEPFRFIHKIEDGTYTDKIQTVFLTSGDTEGIETVYNNSGSFVNTTETGPSNAIKGLNIFTQFREPGGTSVQQTKIWRHNSRIALGIQGNSDDEGGGFNGNANVAVLLFPSTFQQDSYDLTSGDQFTVGKFMLTDGQNTLLNNTGDYHPFAPATQRLSAPHLYAGTQGKPDDNPANIRVGIATKDLTTSNVLHVAGDIGTTANINAVNVNATSINATSNISAVNVNATYLYGDGSNISGIATGDITSVTAGDGLFGGGSSGDVTLQIIPGNGVNVGTSNVYLDPNSNLNVDHDNTSIIAGSGLSGGGTINQDRTLNIGEGTGITVNVDDVALNVEYVRNQFSATGSLVYDSATGQFDYTERTDSEILNLVDADFESDASIHRIAKLRGTEFKIARDAANLVADNYSYSFPNEDGNSGEALITDGLGTLSFGAVASSYGNTQVANYLSNFGSNTLVTSGNITTTGNVTAGYFHGDGSNISGITAATTADTSKTVIKTVIAGEDLAKGDAVYISGGTGDNPEVSKADADDASKMPVFGVTTEAVTATNTTDLVIYGLVESYDTTGFTTGDSLFVSTTPGVLTTTKPTGENSLLQTVGKVIKGNSSGGKITVTGAGRTNATPNLDSGNIFIGNGSNQAVTADFTDTANLAIADYDGAITPSDITFTGLLSNGNTGSESANILGNINLGFANPSATFGSVVHVGDTGNGGGEIGHYNPSFIGYGGKSLVIGDGALYVGTSLNFGRQFLNLSCGLDSTNSLGDGTIALADLGSFRSNVQINMPVGNVDGTPNQVVGIKTNNLDGTRLGWYDPITRTSSGSGSANKEPIYNGSNNGWYAFGDLAKTTFDETFDANLTVSGNCFVTQATSLSSTLFVTGITTLSSNTYVNGTLFPDKTTLKQFNETVVALGSQSGDLATLPAFNASNASIFTVTATGGITLNSIPNAVTGSSYTIKITQDGTGSHALSSTFKYQGGDKTLTTAAGNTDVISVVYDGTDYLATLSKDYY